MQTITLRQRPDDGVLRIAVPDHLRNKEIDIVVVIEPAVKQAPNSDWPAGFFEATYGSLADDPLERPPQDTWSQPLIALASASD